MVGGVVVVVLVVVVVVVVVLLVVVLVVVLGWPLLLGRPLLLGAPLRRSSLLPPHFPPLPLSRLAVLPAICRAELYRSRYKGKQIILYRKRYNQSYLHYFQKTASHASLMGKV